MCPLLPHQCLGHHQVLSTDFADGRPVLLWSLLIVARPDAAAHARHAGVAFERRIVESERENVKFNFLKSEDPYHAYYKYKVHAHAPAELLRSSRNAGTPPPGAHVGWGLNRSLERQAGAVANIYAPEQNVLVHFPPEATDYSMCFEQRGRHKSDGDKRGALAACTLFGSAQMEQLEALEAELCLRGVTGGGGGEGRGACGGGGRHHERPGAAGGHGRRQARRPRGARQAAGEARGRHLHGARLPLTRTRARR